MSRTDYINAYEAAAKELDELLRKQDAIDERILSLRQTMNAVSALIQQTGDGADWLDQVHAKLEYMFQTSLTADICMIVSHSEKPLTTSDVRDELNKLGNDLAEQKNPLATINAILGRLTEQGKIKEATKGGRRAWKRIPPPPGPSLSFSGGLTKKWK